MRVQQMSNQNATSMKVTDRKAWAAAAHCVLNCNRPIDEFSDAEKTAILTMRAAASCLFPLVNDWKHKGGE
jgi:hypothetical protein